MSDGTIVIIILFAFAAVVLLAAPQVSESLVRARARCLPEQLVLRMEEEWRAELNALTSRPGKLAFAIALMFTPRRAFVAPEEDSMTQVQDRHVGSFSVLGGLKSLVIVPTVVFAVGGYLASFLLPVRYASDALFVIAPPRISKDLVSVHYEEPIEDRLAFFDQRLRSDSTLKGVLKEFEMGQVGQSMHEKIENLRDDITVRFAPNSESVSSGGSLTALRVRYVGSDPLTAQKITKLLTDRLIQGYSKDRHGNLSANEEFVKSELADLAVRLTEKGKELRRERAARGPLADDMIALDYKLLQSSYSTLFAKNEELRMAIHMENSRQGKNLKLVDYPDVGKPVEPNRGALSGGGALAGFALGWMAVVGLYRKQRRVLA